MFLWFFFFLPRYMKDHILVINLIYAIIWAAVKSLPQVQFYIVVYNGVILKQLFKKLHTLLLLKCCLQGTASKVMFEHTLVKNHIAVRSSTALSLLRHLETYKNTHEHTQVCYL